MRKGSKLIFFEFNRVSKMYFILLAGMLISQVLGFYVMSKGYMSNVYHHLHDYGFTVSSIHEKVGIFTPEKVIQSIWVAGPLLICMGAMLAYTFLIWYRDWYGPHSFVFRLLMLPVDRLYIFLGKAISLLIMVTGIIAFQLFILHIGKWIITWNVPVDFRSSLHINDMVLGFNYLTIFFPFTVVNFFTLFGGMFVSITIVFTAILFERSYAKKGIFIGFGYIGAAIFVIALPSIVEMILQRSYVYPAEMFWIQVGLFILVGYVSIRMSVRLLNESIHV